MCGSSVFCLLGDARLIQTFSGCSLLTQVPDRIEGIAHLGDPTQGPLPAMHLNHSSLFARARLQLSIQSGQSG